MPNFSTFIKQARAIREEEKSHPNQKIVVKWFISTDDLILYTENPKDFTKKNKTKQKY